MSPIFEKRSINQKLDGLKNSIFSFDCVQVFGILTWHNVWGIFSSSFGARHPPYVQAPRGMAAHHVHYSIHSDIQPPPLYFDCVGCFFHKSLKRSLQIYILHSSCTPSTLRWLQTRLLEAEEAAQRAHTETLHERGRADLETETGIRQRAQQVGPACCGIVEFAFRNSYSLSVTSHRQGWGVLNRELGFSFVPVDVCVFVFLIWLSHRFCCFDCMIVVNQLKYFNDWMLYFPAWLPVYVPLIGV